mgnify:CR=1 FL=1
MRSRIGRIADALEVSTATIERVRQRFVEQGLEAALVRKKQARPSRERSRRKEASSTRPPCQASRSSGPAARWIAPATPPMTYTPDEVWPISD